MLQWLKIQRKHSAAMLLEEMETKLLLSNLKN